MTNTNDAPISGEFNTPRIFKYEVTASLTDEALSLVGYAAKGPAFVPQQIRSYGASNVVLNTWTNIFGNLDEQKDQPGPFGASAWLNGGGTQLSYTRVLGIGDGQGKGDNLNYNLAGFVVGDSILSGSSTYGVKSSNPKAVNGGINGRTYFLGKIVKNNDDIDTTSISPYKNYLQQIGFDNGIEEAGLITDVIMTVSGASLFLQKNNDRDEQLSNIREDLSTSAASISYDSGSNISYINNPRIFLMGYKNTECNFIKISEEPYSWHSGKTTFLNEDVKYVLERGHLNYSKTRKIDQFSKITDPAKPKYFITKGSGDWNSEEDDYINYESFESIYQKAKTPWIVSQPVNTYDISDTDKSNIAYRCKKLFRFRTYSDGSEGNKYRFRIKPRRLGKVDKTEPFEKWSLFDVVVYYFDKYENTFKEILNFKNLNLDPESDNYIGAQIGTEYSYYDIKTQKVITEGLYLQTNNHVYVEIDDDVEYNKNISSLIPSGFMPYPRINHSNLEAVTDLNDANVVIKQNPIQFVGNALINQHSEESTSFESEYPWGILFDKTQNINFKYTKNGIEAKFFLDRKIEFGANEKSTFYGYTKYFQNYKNINKKVWIEDLTDNDTDAFNNFFHLEKIRYSPDGENLEDKWNYSYYQRDGDVIANSSIEEDLNYKYVSINNVMESDTQDDSLNAKFLSFDLFSYGGFDGLNILDDYKRYLTRHAVSREYEGELSGETKGQTYYSYKIGHDLASNDSNCRVDILSLPGISTPEICREFSIKAENERRYTYLFDIPEYGSYDELDDDSYSSYNLSLIRDSYYYKNLIKAEDQQFDKRQDIKHYIQDATNSTLDKFKNLFINSKYSIGTLNTLRASYTTSEDILKLIELPSTVAYISALISSNINTPLDKNILNNNNLINFNFTGLLNAYYIDHGSSDFDKTIKNTKNIQYSINPVIIDKQGNIKFNSSNNLSKNNLGLLRLQHNVRIYLYLVRIIKNLLTVVPLINGTPVLFNNFSTQYSTYNVKAIVSIALNQFLNNLVNNNIIRDYAIDLNLIETRTITSDKYNNIFRGTIAVSLYGQADNNIINLDLENLLNDVKDFTDEQGTGIIQLSV